MLAAELLRMNEFELFRAAHRAWFRERVDDSHIERHFAVYMFEGTAPFWVRQFTRTTLDAHGVQAGYEEPSLSDMLRMGCRLCEAAMRTLRLTVSLFLPARSRRAPAPASALAA